MTRKTMGALNSAIPFTLIAWGQTRIGSGLAAIDGRLLAACRRIIGRFSSTHEP